MLRGESEQPSNLIQQTDNIFLVDDWRDGVQTTFEPNENHTAIKLFENGVMKDKKMISQDIK